MGDGVTKIGDHAFDGCPLTTVTFPNSVAGIGDYAFYGCALASVTIGSGVTSVGSCAFQGCSLLTSATIPSSVTNIGDGAFAGLASLTSVTISNGVTTIGQGAFQRTGLTSVAIPGSVTGIGYVAFSSCYSLVAITVDELNSTYSSANGVLFNKSKSVLIQYPAGKTACYAIPGGVTNIGGYAFYECNGLGSVTIPSSVNQIGEYAFAWCYGLHGAIFNGNAPTNASSDAFAADYWATLYYFPETYGWGPTFGSWPTTLWNPRVQTGTTFGVRTNRFGFTIAGTTNLVVVVEACTNLANPIWSPVKTNTLTGGSSYFSDSQWTNYPSRLYRIRSP
jgi:hypothetical protein